MEKYRPDMVRTWWLMLALTTLACGSEDEQTDPLLTISQYQKVKETNEPVESVETLDDVAIHSVDDVSLNVECRLGQCVEVDHAALSNMKTSSLSKYALPTSGSDDESDAKSAQDSAQLEEIAELLTTYGSGENLIEVTVELEDPEFDFTALRGLDDPAARKLVVKERRDQLRASRRAFWQGLKKLGGEVTDDKLIGGNTMTALVPAKHVVRLKDIPTANVKRVVLPEVGHDVADGRERRKALGLGSDGMRSRLPGGNTGSTRPNGSNRVKYGIVEHGPINSGHASFKTTATGFNRILDTDLCKLRGTRRRCINSSVTSSGSHATTVASVLMGDLEDGQIASISSSTERYKRSGIVPEATVHFYGASNNKAKNIAKGIEEATFDENVDVINLSWNLNDKYCGLSSGDGIRDAIQAAVAAGVVVVVAAGNDGDEGRSCSVGDMATYPESIAVGALNDVSQLSDLDSVARASYSGNGALSAILDGTRSVTARPVDLTVTGTADLVAGSGGTGFDSGWTGTSFAAPQVAGAIGLLKEWAERAGSSYDWIREDPFALRVLLSVMGDGASGAIGGSSATVSVSTHHGFGHLRFVDLNNDLGSGGGWGVQRRYLGTNDDGRVIEWSVGGSGPESTSVNGWKFAAIMNYQTYDNSPDVKFQLIDKCPSGGGIEVIRTATRHALKARMRLRSSEMATKFHGRCLYIRATVDHVKRPVNLYTADYFYTNSRSNHDM